MNASRSNLSKQKNDLPTIQLVRNGSGTNKLAKSQSFKLPTIQIESPVLEFKEFQSQMKHPMDTLLSESREPIPAFDSLCHDLVQTLGDLESSIEDLQRWKDDFVNQNIPANVKLEITLMFSKLFRSKSDLHGPIFEIIRQVMIYARNWNLNREKLLELEQDYHRHYYILDVAIRKLEAMQVRVNTIKAQHQLSLWTRLANRVLYHHSKGGVDVQSQEMVEQKVPTPVMSEPKLNKLKSMPSFPKQAPKVPTDWDQLKETIINTILDDPVWKKETKRVINQFKKTLLKHFHGVSGVVQELIRRNVPSTQPKLEYLSQRSGTLRYTLKPFPRARSISLPNLSLFYKSDQVVKEYQDLCKAQEQANELDMYGVPIHKDEEKVPNPLLGRVRSNSTSCVYDFGPYVQLSIPFEDKNDIQGGRVVTDALSEGGSDVESSYTEKDERAFKALLNNHTLQENMAKFLNERVQTAETNEHENNLEDLEKETFNLQDVMELTLLHAQQLHVMKENFEDKEKDWKEQLEKTTSEKDKEIEELRQRLVQVQQEKEEILAQRIPIIQEPFADQMEGFSLARSKSKVGSSLNINSRFKSNSNMNMNKVARAPSTLLHQAAPPPVPTSTSIKNLKPSKENLSKQKQYVQNIKRQPFESIPFKLGFFERLEWFTEMSQQYHQSQRQQVLEKEKRENEKRLAHLNLLREEVTTDTQAIPAEFMPMPGTVPPTKNRDIITLAEHGINYLLGIPGPWGGRFKMSKAKKHHILNLFDISLDLPPEEKPKPFLDDDE